MTVKSKAKYMLLLYRIRAAWKILFSPNLHWILISVSREEFIKHLKGEEVTMDFSYHKLQEYNFYDLIKKIGDQKDDVDMMLGKAAFEAEAEEYSKRNK